MTKSEFEQYRARTEHRARPVLDALVDVAAVPAGAELELHAEIMKECRRRGWPYIYHDPTRPTGATLGTPDFIIYANNGRVLNVECKTKTGTLSKAQKNLAAALTANGHTYLICRSLDFFLLWADATK